MNDVDVKEQLPLVLDFGKQKKKRITQLKRGEGALRAKIDAAVREAQARLGQSKEIIPVVVLYRKKDRRKAKGLSMFAPW
jgi:hypothetical protein